MNQNDYPHGWPDAMQPFALEGIDLTVAPGDHPFHLREAEAARKNWRDEVAAKPALYDGQMVFFDRVRLAGGRLTAQGHLTPFSTFLWWRKQAAPVNGVHVYGWAVPVSSDGAIIAIRMGAQTANAGKVYCAAGSLDLHDIVGDRCDLAGNLRREVLEETGLDLAGAQPVSGYFGLHRDRRLTIFRFFRFDSSADALLGEISAHMDADQEKEIDAAVAIRNSDPAAHPYSSMMIPILRAFFDGEPIAKGSCATTEG